MTVGILCAIPQELVHLEQELASRRDEVRGGIHFARGRLQGKEVVLAEAGIGKVNTAAAATLLIDRFGADPVLFSGVAGGLDPALEIGDLVIAERTIQHDAGVIEEEVLQPYQAGHVPFFNPTERLGYTVPPDLLERAAEAVRDLRLPPFRPRPEAPARQPRVLFGTILSGDQYIHCERTRTRLFRSFGGQAVEMEGGALGQVCEAFGCGWLDIRALSDLAGRESRFDFAAFVDQAARNSALVLQRLLPFL